MLLFLNRAQVGATQGNTEADMKKWGDRVHVSAWDALSDVDALAVVLRCEPKLLHAFRVEERAAHIDALRVFAFVFLPVFHLVSYFSRLSLSLSLSPFPTLPLSPCLSLFMFLSLYPYSFYTFAHFLICSDNPSACMQLRGRERRQCARGARRVRCGNRARQDLAHASIGRQGRVRAPCLSMFFVS